MSKEKSKKVALYNVGARTIQYSGGALAPKQSAELEAEEAKKLLGLYDGELTDGLKAAPSADDGKAKAALKEAEEKIADLEAAAAEDKKALDAANEKIAELEKSLEAAIAPATDGAKTK